MLVSVVLRGLFAVMGRVEMVSVRDVRVMRALVVIAGFVVFGGMPMVFGRVLVMLGRLAVVFRSRVSHGEKPPVGKTGLMRRALSLL